MTAPRGSPLLNEIRLGLHTVMKFPSAGRLKGWGFYIHIVLVLGTSMVDFVSPF